MFIFPYTIVIVHYGIIKRISEIGSEIVEAQRGFAIDYSFIIIESEFRSGKIYLLCQVITCGNDPIEFLYPLNRHFIDIEKLSERPVFQIYLPELFTRISCFHISRFIRSSDTLIHKWKSSFI